MIPKLFSGYMCNYPKVLAYMWQASEYELGSLIKWWKRTEDFSKVSYRGDIVQTRRAKIVLAVCWAAVVAHIILNALTMFLIGEYIIWVAVLTVLAILAYPIVVVIYSSIPILLYKKFVYAPSIKKAIALASKKFSSSEAIVIAVAGSYGKTTMKELLAHIMQTERKIAYTSGNKNVLLSQAAFASTLDPTDEIVIVEFGEGAPGDVEAMTKMVEPDYAVVTGLAPNHLDKYESLDGIAKDFEFLIRRVGRERSLINGDSKELADRFDEQAREYTAAGFDGWKVSKVKVSVNSTSFTLRRGNEKLSIEMGLVGRHNIGPVCVAICLAMDMDISKDSIKKALRDLQPYEHRLQPKPLAGGWLVDDAYNGNIDGIEAGLTYLKEIEVSGKKLYVTSGLVDQGEQTEAVHMRIGKAIADTAPDKVYLIQNSSAPLIQKGLDEAEFKGDVTLIEKPLEFYESIESIMAVGDVVLIQNDWPDNYS